MAATFCDKCTLFKEDFESFTGDYFETAYRTPYPSLASLEESALWGCSLCQIIYQSWYYDKQSALYNEHTPFILTGCIRVRYDPEEGCEPISQIVRIQQTGAHSTINLSDFCDGQIDEQDFHEYQSMYHQIINPNAPDSIRKAVSLASAWLQNCHQTHWHCESDHSESQTKVLPTRLIDVGTDSPHQPPRVFVPRRHLRSLKYIALSYAWGSGNSIKTTSSNLEAMTQGLPWLELPKTIQDAILITRGLGVRYLWVDAFCILQSEGPNDMKHKEDWSYEAARFGQYYQNALLTIAATGASSSDNGLLLPRPALRFEPKSITFRSQRSLSYTVRPRIPSWYTETIRAPLLGRGWAVQERFLSRRVLHFAKNMILWECNDCRASELDPHGLNPIGPEQVFEIIHDFMTIFLQLYIDGRESITFMDEWYDFIEQYSDQNFTFVADRLPALSGIAAIIHHHTQKRYVAGLWESGIVQGLAWMTEGPFRFITSHLLDPQGINNPKLKLPSWCWAASRGRVGFAKQTTWIDMLQVEACEVRSQGIDTSGQLLGGKLTVRGLFGMLNLCNLGFVFHPGADVGDHVLGRDPREGWYDYTQIAFMDNSVDPQVRNVSQPCLLVGITKCLDRNHRMKAVAGVMILQSTRCCSGTIEEYRRIGFICLPSKECESIFCKEMVVIDLV